MSLPITEHPRLRAARRLESEISELAGHLAAATCRFLLLIAEFDHLGGWAGHRSCAQWLSWRCALSPSAAREHLRIGHALHQHPLIREAFAAGRLSYSKVRAITRVADRGNEAELVQTALATTAAQLERIVRGMRRATRSQITERHHRRTVSWHWDEDGMLVLHARLDPDEGALALAALTAAQAQAEVSAAAEGDTGHAEPTRTGEHASPETDADASAEAHDVRPTPAEPPTGRTGTCDGPVDPSPTRADAFRAIMTSYLASKAPDATDGEAFQIVVPTNASTLSTEDTSPSAPHEARQAGADADRDDRPGGVTEHGTALPRDTVLRLACTAATTPATISQDGTPMDIGRKTRKVSASLRRAVRLRDSGTCRFPGCTARRRLHAHHIQHWADGGPTTLANLVSLCPAHHWAVHEGGHRLQIDDRRQLKVTGPDGRVVTAAPSIGPGDASLLTTDPGITADTIRPGWDGTPLNLDYAIFSRVEPALADREDDTDPAPGQSAA